MKTKDLSQSFKECSVLLIMFWGVLLIGLYHAVIGAFLDISVWDVIKGIGMQFLGILIPGMALWTILYTDEQNIIGGVTVCYALGYSFNIVSYFLLVPWNLGKFAPLYLLLVLLVSVWIIKGKSKTIILINLEKQDFIFVLIFFVYLCLNTIAYSGANAPPTVLGSVWYPKDLLYWIENAGALMREFPPMEPRVGVDEVLYYHYFSSIQLAFSSLATGIDMFTLGVSFFSLGKTILYIGGGYLLFNCRIKRKELVVLGTLILCFCDGFGELAGITWISHTWSHPFGFDIGFAFGLVFLYFFYLQCNEELFDIKIYILSIITFFVCAGSKMPVAVIVIGAAGIVCFSWLKKKKYKLAFVYGVSFLTLFGIIAIGCAGVGRQSGQTGDFSITQFIQSSELLQIFYTCYGENSIKWILGLILCGIQCVVGNPLIVILFILGGLSLLVDDRMKNGLNLGLLIAGILGMLLGVINIQPGHSQMYFTMAAFIPSVLLGLVWLDTNWNVWNMANKRLAMILCGGMLIIEIYLAFFHGVTYYGNGIISAIKFGVHNISSKRDVVMEIREDGLQEEDFKALEWVRENTPLDSTLLTDRGIMNHDFGYMYYGAFSERQMYIEGDVYFRERYIEERENMKHIVSQVFGNSEEVLDMVIEEGVDYIIQTKWLTPSFEPNPLKTDLVYESDTIRVYKAIK